MVTRTINLAFVLSATFFFGGILALLLIVCAWLPEESLIKVRRFITHLWAKVLVLGLGMRVVVKGPRPPFQEQKLFVVSNHYGPLDIIVMASVMPLAFVSRHDLANWPGIGLLARMAGTLFANRDLKASSKSLVDQITERLAQGAHIMVFAEGVSTDGEKLLPFKTSLFQAPVLTDAPVVPVTLFYESIHGNPLTTDSRDTICWYANMPFIQHIMGVLGNRGVKAEVIFNKPFHPSRSRKETAAQARFRVHQNYRPLFLVKPDRNLPELPATRHKSA
jgi:1-acyl-sn-glycerol-3-phosphate acyltransferase